MTHKLIYSFECYLFKQLKTILVNYKLVIKYNLVSYTLYNFQK